MMPTTRTILILEDNGQRIAGFQNAAPKLGRDYELKVWRDAHSMMAECEPFFASAALICLDHDLDPQPGVTTDPGTGLDVAQFLADFLPVCPILIHTSNTSRAYSMQNELRFAGWVADRVDPIRADWIETSWLRRVREILGEYPNTWSAKLPLDHSMRVERMRVSLDGLGLGDAIGEMLSYRAELAPRRLAHDAVAVGAALAWQLKNTPAAERPQRFFDEALRVSPESRVRRGILLASQTPANIPVEAVARALGNGSLVTAPDTVPFCLWIAAHHMSNFSDALAHTIRVGGDCDTNAAIVGGIVALSVGRDGIPADWLKARETAR